MWHSSANLIFYYISWIYVVSASFTPNLSLLRVLERAEKISYTQTHAHTLHYNIDNDILLITSCNYILFIVSFNDFSFTSFNDILFIASWNDILLITSWDSKCFWTKNLFGPKIVWTQKFWTPNFFGPKDFWAWIFQPLLFLPNLFGT